MFEFYQGICKIRAMFANCPCQSRSRASKYIPPVAGGQSRLSKSKYDPHNKTGQKNLIRSSFFVDAEFSQPPIRLNPDNLLKDRRPANFVTFERSS